MEVVTLYNRTSQNVDGTWDGKPYRIKAHAKEALPLTVAEAIKRQNPVMGSEDPYSGSMDYLVAILEQGDDDSPVEQNSKAITRMNRAPLNKNEEVVKGDNGIYSVRDVAQTLPLASNTRFGDR
jgi:hypothetical protein